MNQITGGEDNHPIPNLLLSLSLKHVNYSCGSCGYHLNLNSGNRNTSTIGSKYEKSIKRGLISFFSIDETRFTQIQERRWFRRRTKLLCSKCGYHIGTAHKANNHYNDDKSVRQHKLRKSYSMPWDGISDCDKIYEIKIRALQPSSSDDSVFFL